MRQNYTLDITQEHKQSTIKGMQDIIQDVDITKASMLVEYYLRKIMSDFVSDFDSVFSFTMKPFNRNTNTPGQLSVACNINALKRQFIAKKKQGQYKPKNEYTISIQKPHTNSELFEWLRGTDPSFELRGLNVNDPHFDYAFSFISKDRTTKINREECIKHMLMLMEAHNVSKACVYSISTENNNTYINQDKQIQFVSLPEDKFNIIRNATRDNLGFETLSFNSHEDADFGGPLSDTPYEYENALNTYNTLDTIREDDPIEFNSKIKNMDSDFMAKDEVEIGATLTKAFNDIVNGTTKEATIDRSGFSFVLR